MSTVVSSKSGRQFVLTEHEAVLICHEILSGVMCNRPIVHTLYKKIYKYISSIIQSPQSPWIPILRWAIYAGQTVYDFEPVFSSEVTVQGGPGGLRIGWVGLDLRCSTILLEQ